MQCKRIFPDIWHIWHLLLANTSAKFVKTKSRCFPSNVQIVFDYLKSLVSYNNCVNCVFFISNVNSLISKPISLSLPQVEISFLMLQSRCSQPWCVCMILLWCYMIVSTLVLWPLYRFFQWPASTLLLIQPFYTWHILTGALRIKLLEMI